MIFFGENFEEELRAYQLEQRVEHYVRVLEKDVSESVTELLVYQAEQKKLKEEKEQFEKVLEAVFKKNREKETQETVQAQKPAKTSHDYKLRSRKCFGDSEFEPKRQKTDHNTSTEQHSKYSDPDSLTTTRKD